ncbi:adenylate/guanylate cyclase domain-containing protein [Bacteroidota bacterium]
MQKSIFIILLTFSGIFLKAQTNLDSLYAVWQNQNQSDSLRVAAYKAYIWKAYLFSQPDTAYILAEELIAFGLEKNYLRAQVLGYKTQGVSWYLKGNYPKALDYYTQSLKLEEQIGDKSGISSSLNNIGLIYVNQGDYRKALDYYTQGLKIDKQLGDQKGIAQSLNNIGIIYYNLGDYTMALDYHTQSLKIKEQIGDQKGVAASLNNIGLTYLGLRDYPKALDYYMQSLEIKEQIGDQLGIAPTLNNIGIIYQYQGDYPKALDYYTQSLKIKEQIGDQMGIAASLNNIGEIYNFQGDYSKALQYCQRSYELALELGIIELQEDGCTCLYDTYKSLGNGVKALEYYEFLIVIKDSLHAEETAKKLQRMEFQKLMLQDSIEKAEERRLVQDAHIEEVRQKNRTKNIFLGSGVILIFVSLVLWRGLHYFRSSRKQIAHEKEKSENLLLNILPEEIAEELKQTGESKPRKYDKVSILLTDFINFTELSEQMSPEELVTEINDYYKAFDRIINKWGAEKIKTIGDAYMAVGGLPVPNADSVKNTVLAALEMQDFISERKAEMDSAGKFTFEMRVGIHTGSVVAGIVGVNKFQYDIWGDSVNTASLMESSSEAGKVNISRATYEFLSKDPEFTFESRGKVKAKSKDDMEMFFVSLG